MIPEGPDPWLRFEDNENESLYLGLLRRADGFTAEVEGDQLTLRGGSTVLVFKRIADIERSPV